MRGTDWDAWHASYQDADSALSRRLRIIQDHIADWLEATAPNQVRVVSACAGDGRDLLEVLAARRDAARVEATLLENDPGNADRAVRSARTSGLRRIDVRREDAGRSDSFADAVPADLVMLCGVFGNIDDQDVRRLVETLPQLCRPGATVLWTRTRREPDLTGLIRRWLATAGFDEVAFTAPDDVLFTVGRHRFIGRPEPLRRGARLFEFVR